MPRSKRETTEMVKAYSHYVSLGEKRSYKLVAEEFGKSERTIAIWAKSYKWQDRLKRDEETVKNIIVQRTSDAVVKSAEEFKIGSMEFVDTALTKARHKLESGEVDLSRPGDIVNLMKMGLLLRGEATDRRETVQVKAAENARKILEMTRRGGDPLECGPDGNIPVFELVDEAGDEEADSECS